MNPMRVKKYIIPFIQVAFWFVSFNFWNVILNPGVESLTVIQGVEVGWDIVLLLNSIFLGYSALPFIWLIKRRIFWLKILSSVLFAAPILYLLIAGTKPAGQEDDITVIADCFVRNFLYVVLFHLPIVFAVYFNTNYLIKKYLNPSNFGVYVGVVFALCIATAVVGYSAFNYVVDEIFPDLYYISYFKIWELILITAGYILFTSFLYLIWQYARMLVERKEAAQNELLSLKAQINPHFLFNNLNTIYSMAARKEERTSDVILQLSDFLRYVLYDISCEAIPLEKEVEIIRTYVGLQKERVSPEVAQVMLTTEGNFEGVTISPLLLLPLAENCFKHGIGKNPGIIQIFIGFDGKQLLFKTENNIALREKTNAEENGGIGIKNVEKRLHLIYPERHSLEYGVKAGIFRLEMKINLRR